MLGNTSSKFELGFFVLFCFVEECCSGSGGKTDHELWHGSFQLKRTADSEFVLFGLYTALCTGLATERADTKSVSVWPGNVE